MTEPQGTLKIGPPGYKIDPKKLAKAPQHITPYLFLGAFYYTEDYEYFDEVKHLLDIPPEPKTLEQISQELDEKINALIKTTKEKFECSNYFAGKRYNYKFDKIIERFEYARDKGHFPLKLTFNCGGNISLGTSYPTANLEITSNFVIKPTPMGVGYWDVNPNIQIWLKEKPNWLVRKCAKIFFDFGWKDA